MNSEEYPQELSLLAFCYLTELKDAVRVLGVCKAWRALGADRTLWRHRNLPPALALLFARHNIITSFGLRLPFEEVLTVFDPSSARDEGWWFATLLRAAMSERPVGDALRKQVVRLKMGPVSGDLNEAQNAVWTDMVTVFSENSAVTEIDCFALRCKQLSHFKWLPRLREARVELIDCGPRTIAEWWPELVSLTGSISLPEVYQELPLEAPLEHPLATLNVGLIGSDDDHSFVLAFPSIKSLEFADYRMSPHEFFLKADVPFTTPNLEHLTVHMPYEFEHPLEEIQRCDGPPRWSTQIQYSELRTLVLHVTLPVSEVVHPSTVNVGFTNVRACVLSMLRAAPRLRMLTVHGLGLDSIDPLHEPLFNATVMDACHRHAALSTMQFSVRWNQMDIKDGEARRESIVGELSRGVGELIHSATVDWKEVWRQQLQHATITHEPSFELYQMPLALVGVCNGWEISTLAGFAVTDDVSVGRYAVEYLSMRRVRV